MAEKRTVVERMACKVVCEKSARRRPGRGLICDILDSSADLFLLLCVYLSQSIESAAIECLALGVESMVMSAQQVIVRRFSAELPALPILKV